MRTLSMPFYTPEGALWGALTINSAGIRVQPMGAKYVVPYHWRAGDREDLRALLTITGSDEDEPGAV